MSLEDDLNRFHSVEKEVAGKIKQGLVDDFETLGEDCPRIMIHDKEQPGIILQIKGLFRTDFQAIILDSKGIYLRNGYMRQDQVMRFSDFEGESFGEVDASTYIKLAKLAKERLDMVRREARIVRRAITALNS